MMELKVFKFGGASVNSSAGFRNVCGILKKYRNTRLMIVVSAMGKTTNALEILLKHYLDNDPILLIESFRVIKESHFKVIGELFPDKTHPVYGEAESLFDQLRGYIRKGHLYDKVARTYDFEYDQIVSYGELFSSCILYNYLNSQGITCRLFDARGLIMTDHNNRDSRVNWEKTAGMINKSVQPWLAGSLNGDVALTQGFIGSDPSHNTTTLGREGSDYTAAILAYILKTSEVTIWKDVPGVLNADPKWFRNPKKLDTISYREAIELAYYGASVIHPKTIRPLENAGIKLYVKNFAKPGAAGTLITNIDSWNIRFPIYIRKENQVLISISPRDFSFIIEENLSQIFTILAKYRAKANVMQNSAISFSVCLDRNERILADLIEELSVDYEIRYNYNVELFTVRHYTAAAINRLTKGRLVLLEQKTRQTVHLVVK
ncbi:MAG: aspartate kinase [Bacteroidetes bacterium]|nr:aspartate kinase [Bacteroidota bacterium]